MKSILAVIFLALSSTSLFGASISVTGNFTQDDNVKLIPFTVSTSAVVTLKTLSYAGGTNAAGTVIKEGGFDPYLALFSSTGTLIADNDDGAGVPVSTVTLNAYDSLISQTLTAGTYTLALTQYDNYANGPNLSNGFLETGNGNYTAAFGCTNGKFCDIDGNNRTSFYAVDLLNVASSTATPEPGSIGLLGAGLAGAALLARRRKTRPQA